MHLAAPPPRFRHRMQVVQGLLLALLALLAGLRLGAHADDDDASALLAFKSSLGDPPALATWTNGGRNDQGCPLDWSGVTCENGRVAVLDLSGRGIAGPIARDTLGKLSQLTSLNLSRNAFSGTVPDDLGDFAGLLAMDLSHNSLTGPVPSSVGKLQTLLQLRLAGNQLDGAVPEQVADLLQLQELDLSGNRLSGPIPAAIANLASSLVLLNLSSNSLSGPLPDSFQVFGTLETLDLHGNALSGPVNDSLLSLPVVKWIDLSSNRLAGDFPGKRSQIPAFPSTLEYFNVSNNMLEGPLSSPFSTVIADSLKVLDVSNNQLTEPLPTLKLQRAAVLLFGNNRFSGNVSYTLYNMSPFLQELDLSQNQFVGTLKRVTSPTLQYLNLSSNQLEGALPQEFEGNCISVDLSRNRFSGGVSSLGKWGSTMETIHISGNLLNGSLPDDAADALSALKSLDASDNRLTGVIPPGFISFRRLESLDVSSNALSGQVPAFLLNSSSLVRLTLSRNDLSGEIVIPDFGDLSSSSSPSPPPSISTLNLSMNHLSGSIPPSIANLSRLYSLDLSHNELSGSIPSTLSTLSALHDLDLSYNNLTGPIPEELGLALPNLQFLNLSYNDLSGTLPPSLESRFPRSSFDGNPRLRRQGDDPDRASSGGGGKKGSLSALEAGLIGGFTAAAVVLIAAALFIYYKRVSRSGVHHHGQRRGGMVVKRGLHHHSRGGGGGGGPGQEHCGSHFGGAAADGLAPGGGMTVVKPKGILKSHSYRSSAAADTVEDGAQNADGNGHQGVPAAPAVPYVQLQSQVQQEESLAPPEQQQQQPVVLRVCSPERLAGDLFLLDATIMFSAEELSRAPAEVLGRSSHGTSYKATLDSGHVLTVKWLREGLAKSRKKFVVEAKKFGYVKHQNVMSLRGYYWGPREHEKLLVSDFMPAGSLAGRLYERTGRRYAPLTWHQRQRIAVDIARGLSYLHVEQQWPHGNLKASNVLLVEEGEGGGGDLLTLRGRLADYSLHRLVTEAGTANTILNAGALGYRSSELASARKPKPSLEADVYALGVILMEVLTGKGAGDIISGNSGAVDLPDWVRLLANEGRAVDCYDPALVGVHRDQEPPPGMDDMLHVSLSCIAARSVRPSVKVVYEKLAAINPLPTAGAGG